MHRAQLLLGPSPVSIHAPREGSDLQGKLTPNTLYVSIHAPREGSDLFNPE